MKGGTYCPRHQSRSLFPMFYVYELRDATGKPFYIGKGNGLRMHQHEREILEKLQNLPGCEALVNKINLSSTL